MSASKSCLPVLLLSVLTGCAGKLDYQPPATQASGPTSREVAMSRDQLWEQLVPQLSKQFYVINTIDKQSGLINVSYSGDPSRFIDCGHFTSYVRNARGERTYSFAGASPNQSYEVMSNGQLVYVQRRMNLDGRLNIVVEPVGAKAARVTVSTKYVVTKIADFSNPQGQSLSRSDTISFNTGGSASFPGPTETSCRSNGRLETEILDLLGGAN